MRFVMAVKTDGKQRLNLERDNPSLDLRAVDDLGRTGFDDLSITVVTTGGRVDTLRSILQSKILAIDERPEAVVVFGCHNRPNNSFVEIHDDLFHPGEMETGTIAVQGINTTRPARATISTEKVMAGLAQAGIPALLVQNQPTLCFCAIVALVCGSVVRSFSLSIGVGLIHLPPSYDPSHNSVGKIVRDKLPHNLLRLAVEIICRNA